MRAGRPSVTARWIAAQRARLDGTRPSTPAGDPAAERRLYEGMGRFFVLPGLRPTGMAERTRFIDQEVAGAIGRGVEQIVILGAGYDGRALRFGGGPTRWFEVDYPATQADKQARLGALGLAEVPQVTYVGADLMRDNLDVALTAAGHDAGRPTLFICEGLLAYLSLEVSAELCRTLRARAAAGSVLTANVGVRAVGAATSTALHAAVDGVLTVIGERRRMHFRPGDVEKLMVVTGWLMVRSATSQPTRSDPGSHLLVLAAEPA